ncbi:MAG TPA: transglutaminase family protein [Bryobacteraceae bacterium]|nr:transglutaminase family protein [Bryobacteraceae bacterium]
MFYAIRHFTRFRYSHPVWQSAMELRMQPRSENTQRCFTFQLSISPQSRVFSYQDHFGNFVHHFDVPGQHRQLTITADALVGVEVPTPLPESLGPAAWQELDAMIEREDYWDMLMPSRFARTSPELEALAQEVGVVERAGREPLELLTTLNSRLYQYFSYVKSSTGVNSAVEDAIRSRQGVCQDFAHTMIAMVRNLRIPCRYVSGYLHRDPGHADRSDEGATHAWVEALLPHIGWVGFDPTNNLIVGGRHIRTAIGRDYSDVSPTVGTMKGTAETELQVRVRVTPSDAVLPPDKEFAADEEWSHFLENNQQAEKVQAQQQQQQ